MRRLPSSRILLTHNVFRFVFFFSFFFQKCVLGTTPKRNERQVERLFFLFGHARRGKAWFLSTLSILFYSILSLSVSLRRAPRFSLLAVDSCARLLSECCLAKKTHPFFSKKILGTLEFCRRAEKENKTKKLWIKPRL